MSNSNTLKYSRILTDVIHECIMNFVLFLTKLCDGDITLCSGWSMSQDKILFNETRNSFFKSLSFINKINEVRLTFSSVNWYR